MAQPPLEGRDFARVTRPALIVGLLAAAAGIIVGILLNPAALLRAYLIGYFYWLGIALGCLAVVMIQNLAGGYWGAAIRRLLEAGARTLPLLAVLYLPLLLGMGFLYPWTHGLGRETMAAPGFNQVYLSVPFFIIRAIIYWAVWLFLSIRLTGWSRQRDTNPDPALTSRMRRWSAPGLIVLALTVTFAAFDWLMSLELPFASSIYGGMIGLGCLLGGFAFVVMLLTILSRRAPFAAVVTPDLLNSLGSLLLAFLMLWAYFAFSQLILIYAGNLPEEAIWYVRRIQGAWVIVGLAVAILDFIIPFCVLIVRDFKRNPRILGATAALIVISRMIDLYWVIRPSFLNFPFTWLDVVLPVLMLAGVGGVWLAAYFWRLSQWPLVATSDPRLVPQMEAAHE
jgi:hypothetical protein